MVIPTHVPVISDLRFAANLIAPADRQTVEAVFSAADEQSDLGDLPYVWFTISCGGKPTVGVVRGKRNGTSVRASIPRPAPSACNLELRVSDAQNIDSNTLKAGGL